MISAQILHRAPLPCANLRPMAARQIWLFLTEADVRGLLSRLEQHEPGLVASSGRYLKGDPQALLGNPQVLARRESLPGEVRHYLFHRRHSADVVAHPQPAGPFTGWSQIDEERSDCLVLRVPAALPGEIGPSRLYASTSFWRGPVKTRKRPKFAIWANQTLRWILSQHPSTAIDFMRIGPDALARARLGELQPTYLYRPLAPEPIGRSPTVVAPEGTIVSASASDEDD